MCRVCSNATLSSTSGVTYVRRKSRNRRANNICEKRSVVCFAVTIFAHEDLFPFFRMRFSSSESVRFTKNSFLALLWRRPSPLAYTLRLAQRRHAEIEQNGARGPDDRSRRSLPATRGTVPASIATASPPRRAIACRPARFLPPTPTETDRCPPPAPRPQEAIFPEALKSLKEADPDVYALVQKEKLRQMCVQAPTRTNATRSRAIDAMSSCHTTDFPISLIISRQHLAFTERRLAAVLAYSSSRAPTAEASSSSRARTSPAAR